MLVVFVETAADASAGYQCTPASPMLILNRPSLVTPCSLSLFEKLPQLQNHSRKKQEQAMPDQAIILLTK
jgi:hypothetical protein